MIRFWQHLIRNDLRSRVMVTLLVFSMVPLSVAAYQGYHCGQLAVVDLTKLHVTSVIEARHGTISEWLHERESDILGLVELPGLREVLESTEQDSSERNVARLIIESIANESSSYESMALYRLDWTKTVEVNYDGEHEEDELLMAPFIEALSVSQGIHFDVAHEHETGEIGIHFGCPVRNESERVVGYLVANLNLTKSIAPLLQDRSGLWRTGKAYIISQDLEIISHPQDGTTDGTFQKSANPILTATTDNAGHDVRIYRGYSGNEVLGTAMNIPFKDWSAVVEIDVTEAMHWIDVLFLRVAITMILSLTAILVAGLILSRAIAKPFVEIAGVAHEITEGSIEANVVRSGIHEAEEVRHAFASMVKEIRRNERLLVQSGRLAAIGELTSSIVHEMRNPLSSIKMNLQALGKDLKPDWQTGELVDIATEQTQRLEQMLIELLQYGKPTELNVRRITFGRIVDCCLEASRESISANSANVETLDELEAHPIWTDKELVCRILSNLVRNAAESAGVGAQVTIVGKPSVEDELEITLEVHDNGPGVPSEQIDRIFAPFHTTKPEGIGLGLAVVKNCVDALGGSIDVMDSPNGGAAFIVRLPNLQSAWETVENKSE